MVCARQLPSRCTQDEILRLSSALINCGARFGPHKAHSLSFAFVNTIGLHIYTCNEHYFSYIDARNCGFGYYRRLATSTIPSAEAFSRVEEREPPSEKRLNTTQSCASSFLMTISRQPTRTPAISYAQSSSGLGDPPSKYSQSGIR
jgi:hypothetical protein